MKRHLLIAAAAMGLAALTDAPAYAGDPAGVWTAAEGKSRVRVAPCGKNICGNVAWLREPNDDDGKPKLDKQNSNTALRTRPILGVPILLSMAPDGTDKWKGSIYNAEDGKTYAATFTLTSANSAQVQGCVAGIFCKSQTWSRN